MNCDTAFSKFTRSIFKKRPKHLGCKGAEPRAYWTLDEFIQFRNVVADKPEYYSAFEVLYWTGMRMGEMLALRLGDIDFDNLTIKVDETYTRLKKKQVAQCYGCFQSFTRRSVPP